jgi:hypothetical protein
MLVQAFLVAFGGTFVGYGLAFPFKYPPHRMMLAGIGMFAAQAWQSGSSFGLLVYISLMALLGCVRAIQKVRAKRGSDENNSPSGRQLAGRGREVEGRMTL